MNPSVAAKFCAKSMLSEVYFWRLECVCWAMVGWLVPKDDMRRVNWGMWAMDSRRY